MCVCVCVGNVDQAAVVYNDDRNMTYSCSYTPTVEGQYTVSVRFAGQDIPKSPFIVGVKGKAGDPSKVTASGPGLHQNGVVENQKTHFEVFTKGTRHRSSPLALSFHGCFYRVRGVGGSCAEHLTVESYTIIISLQSYLLS